MSEDREFEGKDLDEALALAATTLGIPQDDLHYEIVEQGRRGLLGLGVKAVRIRVKPPIEVELPHDETTADPPPPPSPRRKPRGARASRKPAASQQPDEQPKKEKAARQVDEQQLRDVEQLVRTMVERMGLELEIEVQLQGSGVNLQITGADQEMLVARNAELLSSIQFLLNRMQRRAWPGVGWIQLSCNGETRPRDEELMVMARKMAEQVASSGKTRKLRPMNAYERRLVHLAVREFGGLTSSSDGNGSLKRVRISKVRNEI